MRSAIESIMSRRRDGNGRRGVIVLVTALLALVFVAALAFSSDSSYGATAAKPAKQAAKKPKPKVKASIRRGQLNVLGTAGNNRITLRLKPGNKSRLQVDAGSNGSAEFTFKRSAFNRIVVHGASGADALSINERFGVFTNTEATSLFGDAGNDLLRSGSAAERLFGGSGNDTIDGKRGNDLIEGGAGSDLVVFNGSNAAEKFEFSAQRKAAEVRRRAHDEHRGRRAIRPSGVSAARTTWSSTTSRVPGSASSTPTWRTTGLPDVVDIKGSAAANELRVGGAISISGIGAAVNVSRAQAANDKLNIDPGAGSDRVTVEGTAGNDTIGVAPSAVAPHIAVSGGPAGLPIDVVNSETLAIEALAGNDTLNAGLGLAALTQLTLDGGAGNDAINGGDGNDSLRGGTENDAIDGNRGDRHRSPRRRRRLVHVGSRRRQRQGGRRGRHRHDGLQRRRSRGELRLLRQRQPPEVLPRRREHHHGRRRHRAGRSPRARRHRQHGRERPVRDRRQEHRARPRHRRSGRHDDGQRHGRQRHDLDRARTRVRST